VLGFVGVLVGVELSVGVGVGDTLSVGVGVAGGPEAMGLALTFGLGEQLAAGVPRELAGPLPGPVAGWAAPAGHLDPGRPAS
jgi:hypothetical protein